MSTKNRSYGWHRCPSITRIWMASLKQIRFKGKNVFVQTGPLLSLNVRSLYLCFSLKFSPKLPISSLGKAMRPKEVWFEFRFALLTWPPASGVIICSNYSCTALYSIFTPISAPNVNKPLTNVCENMEALEQPTQRVLRPLMWLYPFFTHIYDHALLYS